MEILHKSKILLLLFLSASMFISSCSAVYQEEWSGLIDENLSSSNSIFVFLDGTANDPESGTNVWKLYQIIKNDNKKFTKAIYIEGVGKRDRPLSGMTLGRGMQKRILIGYKYITENYKDGDKIYIFGFSRGAHQARALAGLIAYSGLPVIDNIKSKKLISFSKKIIDITKNASDKKYLSTWLKWDKNKDPLLKSIISKKLGISTKTVEIEFLGVWDTVPGSKFKKFEKCKEQEDTKKGDRYKSDSYPPIKRIFHAVSIDEKRSKFHPLLLCDAINPKLTSVNEAWFPGAHADVGGGYKDYSDLSGLSLSWIVKELSNSYSFKKKTPIIKNNYKGVAHWSIRDWPANFGSSCKNRVIPQNATIDKSYSDRKGVDQVPVRIAGVVYNKKYPLLCP